MNNHQTRPPVSLSRRHFLLGAAGTMGMAALASCVAPLVNAPTTASTTTPGAATNAYPVTINDATNVTTTIAARPQRVVTLTNLWDLDALLALGIAPVQFGIRAFV